MLRGCIVLVCVLLCSALHLQDNKINSTVKDVLNAACPGLPIVYITNPSAERWVYGGLHPAAYNSMIDNLRQNNKIVKCPWNTPYSIGGECINCPSNHVFNLETKICQNVPSSFVYDEKQRKFVPDTGAPQDLTPKNQTIIPPVEPLPPTIPPIVPPLPPPVIKSDQYFTDLSNPNLLSNGRPFAQIQQQILNNMSLAPPELKKICPPQQPFWNKKACINCPPHKPYFNLQSLSCTACNQGTVFSPQKHKCQIASIKYLTAPDAPNIQYGPQSQQAYRIRFNIQKQNHPVCPAITPYFNGERCISCNPQYPVFNLQLQRCVGCPPTKIYSKQKNRCVPRADVFPTLQRYLMNIR